MLALPLSILAFAAAAHAADCSTPVQVTTEQMLAISKAAGGKPISETCTASGDTAGSCATAKQVAAGLSVAFKAFNIKSIGKAAGAIGNMMAESGSFAWASKSASTGPMILSLTLTVL